MTDDIGVHGGAAGAPPGGVGSLAATLSDLARTLQEERSVDATLQAIVNAAVGTVPGAQYAALSVVERRRAIHTRAGTDELVFKVDRIQYETGEGPCLSAVYASHAAVAMSDAQQMEHLGRAIAARDIIGQAKGILMERHKLTADQAFSLLTRASQKTNTRLIDVARALSSTGEFNPPSGR